ncbi:hypothetical protein GCM10010430_74750 [Kitasatospora cystarginea]|uniref:Uncharacterized protein n=1 Tax=Kitasatospora cystarginea TaxID=58350 RepID=A0ABP5RZA6_9ACTN
MKFPLPGERGQTPVEGARIPGTGLPLARGALRPATPWAATGTAHRPAFGPPLSEARNAAAEMICHTFEAPLELAPQPQLTAELDPNAVQELRR